MVHTSFQLYYRINILHMLINCNNQTNNDNKIPDSKECPISKPCTALLYNVETDMLVKSDRNYKPYEVWLRTVIPRVHTLYLD